MSLSGLLAAKFARDGAYAAITDPLDGRVAARTEGNSLPQTAEAEADVSPFFTLPVPAAVSATATDIPRRLPYANRYVRLFKSIRLMYSKAGHNLSDTFSNKWIYFVT